MKRLFKDDGAVEIQGAFFDAEAVVSNISNELSKHRATITNIDNNSLSFKSCCLFTKFSHNPMFGISSGTINIINHNTKLLVTYKLKRKQLFWLCNFTLFGFVAISLEQIQSSTPQEVIAYIIGIPLLYFASYAIYYGLNGTLFDKMLFKAANNALKLDREKRAAS